MAVSCRSKHGKDERYDQKTRNAEQGSREELHQQLAVVLRVVLLCVSFNLMLHVGKEYITWLAA